MINNRKIYPRRMSNELEKWDESLHKVRINNYQHGLLLFQDGHVIFANKAVSDVSGYSLEELQSLHLNELMSIIHPEDQEHVFRETEKMLAGNLPNVVQKFRIVRKDGSIRCVNAHLSSVTHENKPALQVAYYDITNGILDK